MQKLGEVKPFCNKIIFFLMQGMLLFVLITICKNFFSRDESVRGSTNGFRISDVHNRFTIDGLLFTFLQMLMAIMPDFSVILVNFIK